MGAAGLGWVSAAPFVGALSKRTVRSTKRFGPPTCISIHPALRAGTSTSKRSYHRPPRRGRRGLDRGSIAARSRTPTATRPTTANSHAGCWMSDKRSSRKLSGNPTGILSLITVAIIGRISASPQPQQIRSHRLNENAPRSDLNASAIISRLACQVSLKMTLTSWSPFLTVISKRYSRPISSNKTTEKSLFSSEYWVAGTTSSAFKAFCDDIDPR